MITKNALILAPMAEISHIAFRMLLHKIGGCDYYFTEMISAKAFINRGKYEKYYINTLPEGSKVFLQLISGDKKALVKAATILAQTTDCHGIDINMGCTAPEITKQNGGIMWMKDITYTNDLLKNLRKHVKNKLLSIKIRNGINDNYPHLYNFVKMAFDNGIDFITLHPRNKKDKMRRYAKWEFYERLKSDFPEKFIIGNGDITSYKTYAQILKQYSPDAIMIGRQAIIQPYFFDMIKKIKTANIKEYKVNLKEIIQTFIIYLEQYLPEDFHLVRLKKFMYFFSQNFFWKHRLITEIQNSNSFSETKKKIQLFFQDHPEEIYKIIKIM